VIAERFAPNRFIRPLNALVLLARDWIGRFVAVQGVDRFVAIGAQAYTALIPLLIVYSSVLPRTRDSSFADVIIERLDLSGSAAQSVRLAFAPAGAVESSVTTVGVVLLIVSALSFTRALQRLYEGVFGLPTRGMRNTKWGLVWLAVVSAFTVIRPVLLGSLDGPVEAVLSLALSAVLWLLTPYLLLGRRLHWRRLLPVALLSTAGMTGIGIWTVIWLPHTISTSAHQFGVIGIGFAMLAWLVSAAAVLVAAASGGAVISERFASRGSLPAGDPRSPGRAEDRISDPVR
jgi:membrane protein